MANSEPEEPPERKKRTRWLMAGGAVSLLIPLAGAVYLYVSENAGAPGPSGRSDLFERRDGGDLKITPTQTAVVPPSALTAPPPSGMSFGTARPDGSSLDFIKSNDDLQSRLANSKAGGAGPPAVAAPPSSAASPAASTAPPVAAPVAAKKTAAKGPKPFLMPKLQPTRGFSSNFGSSGGKGSSGSQSQSNILNNLPAGAQNNPQLQQYLQNHPNGQ